MRTCISDTQAFKALRTLLEQQYLSRCSSSRTTDGVHIDVTSSFESVSACLCAGVRICWFTVFSSPDAHIVLLHVLCRCLPGYVTKACTSSRTESASQTCGKPSPVFASRIGSSCKYRKAANSLAHSLGSVGHYPMSLAGLAASCMFSALAACQV